MDLGDVATTLGALEVDEADIQAILEILTDVVDSLHATPVRGVGVASFGPSPAGAELGHHTDLAHQKVVEAMADMVAGLGGFHDNLVRFRNQVHETDTEAASLLTGISTSAGCVVTPDLSTPSQCTLPTDITGPGEPR